MANADKIESSRPSKPKKPVVEKVEYDGYYLIESVDINGRKSTIHSRGHKLKSWLNFENSLKMNVSVKYHKVTESEYMQYHWTSYVGKEYDVDEEIVIESAGTGSRKSRGPITPVKPIKPKKHSPKGSISSSICDGIAKTDRNIGTITAFME